MTESERSPLARLVLFLVALSLVGSIAGGAVVLSIALSPQPAPAAPTNSPYMDCVYYCMNKYGVNDLDGVVACSKTCHSLDA
jgi:hypothetical protein